MRRSHPKSASGTGVGWCAWMEEDLREISPLYSVQLLFWSRQGVSSEHMTTGLPSSAGQEKETLPKEQ